MSAAAGNGQKSPSSKAAALLTRGAYTQYVSTAKGRERRWRLFSTFPFKEQGWIQSGGTPIEGQEERLGGPLKDYSREAE